MIELLQNHLRKIRFVPRKRLRLRGTFYAIRFQVKDEIFANQLS